MKYETDLAKEIMRDREALRQEAIAREKQERKEKNIFYKIFKKLFIRGDKND